MFFPIGRLRLCYINFMAQFHTLHKHFIHYHVPFNKVVKHSFCQETSIQCACFLETTQKYNPPPKKNTSANTVTSLVNNNRFPISTILTHSVSRLHLTNTIWDPHSVYHTVSPAVYICKAAGSVAPVLAKITASYRDAHRVLYQVGRKYLEI